MIQPDAEPTIERAKELAPKRAVDLGGGEAVSDQTTATLAEALAAADHVIHALELGGEPWTVELMEARDAAVFRHRARLCKEAIDL